MKSVFRLLKKNETGKPARFFRSIFFHVPYVKTPTYLYGKPPLWMDTWTFGTQQQQQHQRKCAVVGVGRLNTSTNYSLQYYRQVHNPLIYYYWFPCMFRLSVTPLPKMNSELRAKMGLFVFGLCYVLPGIMCVTCYQVPVPGMCDVFNSDAVVRDARWSVSMRFFAR